MSDRYQNILGELKRVLGDLAGKDLADAPPSASFFDLGFDSLFLTQASQSLRQRFGVKITFRQLLEDLTTLDAMAAYLAEKAPAPATPAVPPRPVHSAPALAPSIPCAAPNVPAGSLIERILEAQHRVMEQQIALLRSFGSAELPAVPTPAPAPAKAEAKPFGPYRPIDRSTDAGFTAQQQQHLDTLIERYVRKTPESKRRTQQHRRHFADPRSVSGFRPFWKEMVYPIITDRSEGARFWDVDGNEYIDITMGFGTNLLGHNPPFIKQAIAEQLEKGVEVGPQSPLAGEVAELLCELTGHERAAFCNTGSEAVLAAIRIARTVTGRTRIATTSGFHGILDEVLVRGTVVNGVRRTVPVAPGIPDHVAREVLALDYGTRESLDLLRQHAHELAAIFIEPVQSRHPDLQPREFLHEVRKIATEFETALVFDEVINGFRCHLNGAQAYFGVKSDIGTWGKVIGGGLPIGAVTGSAQFMDALDGGDWRFGDASFPEVGVTFFAGTYVRHPLAMAASRAMLRYLKEQGPGLQERLSARTTEFVGRLNHFFRERGAPLHLEHFSSLFYLRFEPEAKYGSLFYFHLREKGLHIWEGRPCFLSTAHTAEDVETIIRIFQESVVEMERGGFLPSSAVELAPVDVPAPAPRVEIPLPAPVPRVLVPVAAQGPMQFSLYFFGNYPAEFHEDKYRALLESARFADANGFTAIWLPERHFHAVGGFSPNPSLLAAALAGETKQLQLRGGSVVLPLHHPVRVAEEWSVVDNLSGGRTGISIASGWHPNDFVFAPSAFETRRELSLEYLATIRRLWRGESVNFATGARNRIDVTLHPLPKQRELPIWLTCIHKDSFIKAGELGVGVLGYLMNSTVDELAEKIALYREALAQHGHDPAKGHVTILLHTFVSSDAADARGIARGPLREYLRSFLDNSQKRIETQGGAVDLEAEDFDFLLDRAVDDYEQGKALIGSPETCAAVVERLQSIGVDELGCFVDFGVAAETVLAHLPDLLALKRSCDQHSRPMTARTLPLSEAQRGLWAITQLGGDAPRAYSEFTTLEMRGALDLPALRGVLQQLVDRHEAFRTTVDADGETQTIHPHLELDIAFEDFSSFAERLHDRLTTFERQHFDFAKGPILAALIVKLSDDRHLLALAFHHLLGNGPSYWIFFEDLVALYEAACTGQPASLEPPLQLSDFVQWRAQRAGSEAEREEEAFWLEQLSGELPPLELPTDRPRPALRTFRAGRSSVRLDQTLVRRLRETGAHERSSLFMMLFAACKVWLFRLSGQNDLFVGVPSESTVRELPGGARLFANTTNMLPLRSLIEGSATFADLLGATKQQVLAASEHQECFFGNLLSRLGVKSDPSRPTLFSVMFNYESGKFERDAGGVHFELATTDVPYRYARDISPFELGLNLAEQDGAVLVECDYNADLFDAETVQRWLGHYRTLLEAICADPAGAVDALPLLTAPERQRLLVDWNATDAAFPEQPVHALIAAQAARTPSAIAVECGDRQLPYADLDRASDRLSAHLQTLGAAPGKLLGVFVERSVEMVVTVLGILKTGAAYVPLDPAFPAARLALMIEDTDMPLIVTERDLASALPPHRAGIVCLDDTMPAAAPQPFASTLEDLAYVIFTSGSTGRPKGVEITHRALANFLSSMQRSPGITSDDVLLAVTTLSFDIAGLELFLPLLSGARVVVVKRDDAIDGRALLAELERRGATMMQATPATWRLLLEASWRGTPKLKALIGGEACPRDLAAQLLAKCGELWNMYGPTETTIWSTIEKLSLDDAAITIGRPIANTRVHIVDRHLQPTPINVPGELLIGGSGLARGYLNRPDLTAEKFIRDPFNTDPAARLYRTGDLARFLSDGRIECLGRIDQQVKLRGFRIELGEIESALKEHPAIGEAAVVLREAGGAKQLVAYCTRRDVKSPELWPSTVSAGGEQEYDDLIYRLMSKDKARNDRFKAAFERSARGKVVLDVGTGKDAILARLCVEAGARKVYAVELLEKPAQQAQALVKSLNLDGQIEVIHGDIRQIVLPEPVDVLVSENLGHIGGAEGWDFVLAEAHRHLKPGAAILPLRCQTYIAAISLPEAFLQRPVFSAFAAQQAERLWTAAGYRYDLRLAIEGAHRGNLRSTVGIFEDIDFTAPVRAEYECEVRLKITQDSRIDGFLLWLKVDVTPGVELDCLDVAVSWLPVYLPVFYPGIDVSAGDEVRAVARGTLAENGFNRDYAIEGQLVRRDGSATPFSYRSCHYAQVYKHDAFYQKLFADDRIVTGEIVADTAPDLDAALRSRLPNYMVPAAFVFLDALPLTANGKLDRRALPAPPESSKTFIEPRTPLEQNVAEIWKRVLGVQRVGVDDNFFEMGGDSLSGLRVVNQLREVTGEHVSLVAIFEAPTVARLADRLETTYGLARKPHVSSTNGQSDDKKILQRRALVTPVKRSSLRA